MKKIIILSLLVCSNLIFAQNYKEELKNVNEILKAITPDKSNELQVDMGRKLKYYSPDRYLVMFVKNVDKVEVDSITNEVSILCLNGEKCVSGGVDGYTTKLTFSMDKSTDRKEFVKRLQKLVKKMNDRNKFDMLNSSK